MQSPLSPLKLSKTPLNDFMGLSNELIQHILSYLYGRDLRAAEHTCQRLRANAREITRIRIIAFKKAIYQEIDAEGKPTALVIGDRRTELTEDENSVKEAKKGLLFHLCRGGNPLAQRAVQEGLNIIEHLGLEEVLDERTSSTGRTCLHAATIAGNNALLRLLLLAAELNIQAQDYEGSTALHLAVIEGRTQALAILLNAGANPNITDQPGNTPLHIAAERGQEVMVRALIAGGTNVDLRDVHGHTAANLAAARGHPNIVAILNGEGFQEIHGPSNATQAEKSNKEKLEALRPFTHASL